MSGAGAGVTVTTAWEEGAGLNARNSRAKVSRLSFRRELGPSFAEGYVSLRWRADATDEASRDERHRGHKCRGRVDLGCCTVVYVGKKCFACQVGR